MTERPPARAVLVQGAAYGDPPSFDVAHNLGYYLERIDEACRAHRPNLVVLPELFTTPYFCSSYDTSRYELAESIPGPTTAALGGLAREHGTFLTAPIFERVVDGEYYNACALIGPDGELCPARIVGSADTQLCARKVHLPSVQARGTSLDEKFWFRPGSGLAIFDTEIGRIGCLICYDRSFPEAWRTLVLAGAELIVVPLSSHGFRESLFVAELETMAAENQVCVAACNRAGPERVDTLVHMFGRSCLISPLGEVIAQGNGEGLDVVAGELDMSSVARTRAELPYLRDRRPDTYRL
jgi:predicted amidohydrolase